MKRTAIITMTLIALTAASTSADTPPINQPPHQPCGDMCDLVRDKGHSPGHAKVGEPAPDFTLDAVVNQEMKSIRLSDYRGKVVLLDFWGNW